MRKHSVISKNQWQCFCDNYTRQHWGLVVKVDAYDPALAKLYCEAPPPRLKTMANNLMFQGIVFEDSSFRLELLICLASAEGLFTHRVMHPTIIVALWTDVGLHEGITIHDKSGGLIHIRFHEPASPELSDNWTGLGSRNRKYVFRLTPMKVKTAILKDPILRASHIEVTTVNGVVKLSGTVDSEQSIGRAMEVANSQKNVKSVQNALVVKEGAPTL